MALLKLLKYPWWRFPPPLSHMRKLRKYWENYWENKIIQLFPKGQGGNAFLKSSPFPKSAGYHIQAGEGLGISGLKFTFFALVFTQKRAEVRPQQFELGSQHKSLSGFKESCLPPFLERELHSAHLLGHDLSLPHVTCCSCWGCWDTNQGSFPGCSAMGGTWEVAGKTPACSNLNDADDTVLSCHHLPSPFGWGR